MQLTPGQVQQRLYDVHHDMMARQQALKEARDTETRAAEAHRMAVAKAVLSEDCPRPKRGENGVTVADRDAWVDTATEGDRFRAAVAEATRKAAEDALRVSRDQASVVQSLSALMRADMQLTQTGA